MSSDSFVRLLFMLTQTPNKSRSSGNDRRRSFDQPWIFSIVWAERINHLYFQMTSFDYSTCIKQAGDPRNRYPGNQSPLFEGFRQPYLEFIIHYSRSGIWEETIHHCHRYRFSIASLQAWTLIPINMSEINKNTRIFIIQSKLPLIIILRANSIIIRSIFFHKLVSIGRNLYRQNLRFAILKIWGKKRQRFDENVEKERNEFHEWNRLWRLN